MLRGDEFNQLSGLQKLELLHAKLTSIAPTSFHPLKSLETLNLVGSFSVNYTIGKELFMSSTNLKELHLSDNNIQAIHPEAFDHLHSLILLDLSGNYCVNNEFWNEENDRILDMTLVKQELKTCFGNFASQKVF
jgi:Leucine-rich repeat (LRR) protein